MRNRQYGSISATGSIRCTICPAEAFSPAIGLLLLLWFYDYSLYENLISQTVDDEYYNIIIASVLMTRYCSIKCGKKRMTRDCCCFAT